MIIDTSYNFGDIVFLKTDPDQYERMVYKIIIYPNGSIMLGLSFGATNSEHYDFEISSQKDLMKELNISDNKAV